MQLDQSERFRRLLRRLPRGGPLAWIEIVLLLGFAFVLAKLAWTIATPVGPFGAWRPRQAMVMPAEARMALFARLDPFYRTVADEGAQPVTSLSLKLFGLRINEATGLGSAIIETPDGVQSSYAVGDEIADGVTLKTVTVDHIVLDKGGADEVLYIDQSDPAPVVVPGTAASRAAATPAAIVPSTRAQSDVATSPVGNTVNFAPPAKQASQPADAISAPGNSAAR